MQGKFITLEGGEGSGKSTHAARLRDRIEAAGHRAIATREPGGAAGALEIRSLLVSGAVDRWDPVSELLLHCAARREHVMTLIAPALAAGTWVVSDRFADSTMAYQGYAQDLGHEAVTRVNDLAVGTVRPDATVILDLPVAAGLARTRGRSGEEDRYERMGPEFHERIRAAFLDIAAREPDRCAVVDASGALDDVADAVWEAVRARLMI